MTLPIPSHLYSVIVAIHSSDLTSPIEEGEINSDWRLGEINVDWVDFTREKSIDQSSSSSSSSKMSKHDNLSKPKSTAINTNIRNVPGFSPRINKNSKSNVNSDLDSLSLQPLLGHYPSTQQRGEPKPLDSSFASGISELGRGVIHLFKHPPPSYLIASIDSHPIGEGSKSKSKIITKDELDLIGEKAEGEDGSLIAILAVPAWMRPSDFIEFIGGWSNCLEGVRMIREATTPNRSIVLLKFRDPLQASDFSTIFTGKAFSTLDPRETCHPIRIHHLILHKLDRSNTTTAIPAFPPSVYSSRARELNSLLKGVDQKATFELPSCPVCLERLDSTVTGLVTLPCAHTFDCDCLRKWGDSRCPVCRLSHLLLSSGSSQSPVNSNNKSRRSEGDITRLTKCSMCDSTENNWICVVCGTVGCGRYEPSKGHARRHWEESGHVLAMELETQRVWDYKGDNYVHRLIQSRSDGKLVELPSASSLVTTSSISRPLPFGGGDGGDGGNNTNSNQISERCNQHNMNDNAGPSSGDVEKMSTIESITLEYSYLLSSQLESMRHHYEQEQKSLLMKLEKLELSNSIHESKLKELGELEKEKEQEQENLEEFQKKNNLKFIEILNLNKNFKKDLEIEKLLSNGLSENNKILEIKLNEYKNKLKEKEIELENLKEINKDLMFSIESSFKLKELGENSGQGGDLIILPSNTSIDKQIKNGKKKSKR
ncbi:uncharacterized protein I206_106256 [Kwoniella pini CBS 10737]|uniref:BRCA1-associated protein n=1 Tax=Kwoniella pini CBS 10737 TaxID=1296096 RepID=A0A1B9I1H5_9TREE|nr:BRCA1-associated protein [Kwoniella pini CBS 10737]OCF49389.1 BRCA1-associated protein [Kwoniella pini CBS 10737]